MARSKTLTYSAYERLRADVLAARVQPGERLNIVELAASLVVSLGAVREALARLAAEGLVVSEPNKGYLVAPISIADLRELTDARIEVEVSCVRRSLESGDLGWESRLLAAHHVLAGTPGYHDQDGDVMSDRWSAAHAAFHEALVAACNNRHLLEIRRSLYARAECYRRLAASTLTESRDVAGEHAGMLRAALDRDHARLARLVASHLEATMHNVQSALFSKGALASAPPRLVEANGSRAGKRPRSGRATGTSSKARSRST